ncbi:MAG: signal peptidase II [Eubacteriales bacterium]
MAYIMMILGVFGVDFVIKNRIERKMQLGEKLSCLKNRIVITKCYNTGAVLGCFKEHKKIVMILTSITTGMAGIFFLVSLLRKGAVSEKLGSALIFGGGLSNLYDRIVRKHVVDYVSFPVKWQKFSKIVFNISDFCIIIGSMLYFIGTSKAIKKD